MTQTTKRSIVHIEIPAAARKTDSSFYNTVFGWDVSHADDSPDEPMPYTMLASGNSEVGIGMPDLSDQVKPGDVLVYIASDDIPADLKAIEAAGGKRLGEPFKVGSFGEMAMFADPTGNRLALWKSLVPSSDAS